MGLLTASMAREVSELSQFRDDVENIWDDISMRVLTKNRYKFILIFSESIVFIYIPTNFKCRQYHLA